MSSVMSGNDGSPQRVADDAPGTRERLQQEADVIAWPELARHFARGVVLRVAAGVDLIDVAEGLAADDTDQFQRWIDNQELARASDEDARRWHAHDTRFLCVVVAPWVLVQEQPATGH